MSLCTSVWIKFLSDFSIWISHCQWISYHMTSHKTHNCEEQVRVYNVGLLTFDYLHRAVDSTHFVSGNLWKTQLVGSTHQYAHTILCTTCTCMSDHPPVAKLHYEHYTLNWYLSLYCVMYATKTIAFWLVETLVWNKKIVHMGGHSPCTSRPVPHSDHTYTMVDELWHIFCGLPPSF